MTILKVLLTHKEGKIEDTLFPPSLHPPVSLPPSSVHLGGPLSAFIQTYNKAMEKVAFSDSAKLIYTLSGLVLYISIL